MREWNKNNPEKAKEYCRRYRAEHPEAVKRWKDRWSKKNVEKMREYRRRYYEKNGPPAKSGSSTYNPTAVARHYAKIKDTEKYKEFMKAHRKKMLEKYPEKYAARRKLRDAVKYGKMVRKPCEKCGNEKSHGHHEDYSKPLDVIWLCHKCHCIIEGRWRGEI